jgi:hypothetical protein
MVKRIKGRGRMNPTARGLTHLKRLLVKRLF